MAALLKKIHEEANPSLDPYRTAVRVSDLRVSEAAAAEPEALLKVKHLLALNLLASGQPEEALKKYDEIEDLMIKHAMPLDARSLPRLLRNRAVCYLRIGENENCLDHHNAQSCLFPIRGDGVHKIQRGSRGAIAELTKLLEKYPGDLSARWLLNIAYGTVGEYPSGVPPKWLIDPKVFASDYDIKTFPDVAGSLGVDLDDLAGGLILDDFDNDGFLDLMVSSWGTLSQLRFFHNNGDGTFLECTESAGLIGETGGLNIIQTDYNNDGYIDAFIMRGAWLDKEGHYPCSLLRNNGDGTFTDVTEEAGLLRFHPTQGSVWFDYDGDGWLDLFISNESKDGDANPCELFHNNRDGTFTECAKACGLDFVGFFKAPISADYDHDDRPDLFISRLDGSNLLLRNAGPAKPDDPAGGRWRFLDVTEEAGLTGPNASFSCWFFDYDNDGRPDLFVSGYQLNDVGEVAADYLGLPHSAPKAHLYRNNGDGTFDDVSKACGVNKLLRTMGCNFGDLDNDGWLDFYVGTGDPDFSTLVPNRMFRNDGGKRFQDVTTSGGFGQLQKGHAIAFGDINNDGEQDIYSVVGGAFESDHYHNQLFANPGHGNKWLKLKLEGVQSNRAAVGVRIKVFLEGPEGERLIARTVGSGGSFGASSYQQEIGLGQAQSIKRIEVFWPATHQTQTFTGLEVNHGYRIRENQSSAEILPLKAFEFPAAASSPAHHHHHSE